MSPTPRINRRQVPAWLALRVVLEESYRRPIATHEVRRRIPREVTPEEECGSAPSQRTLEEAKPKKRQLKIKRTEGDDE